MKKLKSLLYSNKVLKKSLYIFLIVFCLIKSSEKIYSQNDSIQRLNEVVITGTKTTKQRTNSQVIVNTINNTTLNNIQACNLSEGLKFQPGVRIETDCQTCNYTQLRINGLQGGYSQILINGRPIFSPLMSLYGMEQIPTNMIDRIEVIKGAGSSLYGSSSIAGTVNVIMKKPLKNNFEFNYHSGLINNQTHDNLISANTTKISRTKKAGISILIHNRKRGLYDHNNDSFSEIPSLNNFAFGINAFLKPRKNQRLEISLNKINEYRFGGEISEQDPHLKKQAEERTHSNWITSLDYEVNFNDHLSLFTYLGAQNTERNHFTGIFPDLEDEVENYLDNPPYGNSNINTLNTGLQINRKINNFIIGPNTLSLGIEHLYDNVFDEIKAYNYKIDQETQNTAAFLQSDWTLSKKLSLLSGVRLDQHNLIEKYILSPRYSLLYKFEKSQIRLSYGEGFRAPQAFDTDLHIAFAGGGVSRVNLASELKPETSESISGSINYDLSSDRYIYGFTIDVFVTQIKNTFLLHPIGADEFGEIFEKQNGDNAKVQGITCEFRFNYNQKVQFESGFTIQSSQFQNPVTYINGISPTTNFMRTPENYGFAILSIYPAKKIFLNFNYIYTGKMQVPHLSGAENQMEDEILTTSTFHEINSKLNYTLKITNKDFKIDLFAGVKNILNSYQNDFDVGKYRDSNFIYGPSQPRTIFIGLTAKYN
jgi:outer membrane receptor for ferrienterochelin and colicins